jgi:hypothetical protein
MQFGPRRIFNWVMGLLVAAIGVVVITLRLLS